jgi:hypothetical protein
LGLQDFRVLRKIPALKTVALVPMGLKLPIAAAPV